MKSYRSRWWILGHPVYLPSVWLKIWQGHMSHCSPSLSIWYHSHCAMFLKVQQRWLYLRYRASIMWAYVPVLIHEHHLSCKRQKEAYLKDLCALEAAIRLYGNMFRHLISSRELKEAEVTIQEMWASSDACTTSISSNALSQDKHKSRRHNDFQWLRRTRIIAVLPCSEFECCSAHMKRVFGCRGPAASFWAMISCLQQFKEWAEEHVALEKARVTKEQAGYLDIFVYDVEKLQYKSYMTVDYCDKRQQQIYDLIGELVLAWMTLLLTCCSKRSWSLLIH